MRLKSFIFSINYIKSRYREEHKNSRFVLCNRINLCFLYLYFKSKLEDLQGNKDLPEMWHKFDLFLLSSSQCICPALNVYSLSFIYCLSVYRFSQIMNINKCNIIIKPYTTLFCILQGIYWKYVIILDIYIYREI